MLSRRGILGGIICAPAIVRASSLMAVKSYVLPMRGAGIVALQADHQAMFLKAFSGLVYERYHLDAAMRPGYKGTFTLNRMLPTQ